VIAYGDVRQWNAEWLHETVELLNRRCTDLVGLNDEVSGAGRTNRWHGEAALAARDNLTSVGGGLAELISEVSAMRVAMGEAADAVTGLLHGIAEAEEIARRHGFALAEDGTVRDLGGVCVADPTEQAGLDRDRERVQAELADRVRQILRRAEDIDHDLSSVVARCLQVGGVGDDRDDSLTEAARAGGDAGHLSMIEPPPGGTAAANAAWFATLGEGEKNWVLANRPNLIGNLDGVPAHYRHLANVARIPAERAQLQAERDAKVAELGEWDSNPRRRSSGPDAEQKYADLVDDLHAIDAKLESLTDIGTMLSQGDRQLLVLDTTGERAKAAIAVGTVDTADHVAVFTPGMNSTVDDRMEGYDRDASELRKNAVRELQRVGRGDENVAVVTWLNYEPPQLDVNPQDAVGSGKAEDGAARLASFLNGIDASRTDNPHLTALGHSYGSLTTGIALRDFATGVDDVAVFGSPGLGVDDTSRLQAPQGHVYNLEADGDAVADVGNITRPVLPPDQWGWHGRDPGDLPGMRQLSTHDYTAPDGRHFEAAYGHSEYLRADDGKYTTSEWNLANIVAGTGITH
jgi:hypothetical protein